MAKFCTNCGKKLVNGKCVSSTPTCGADEELKDGECVPKTPTCGADEELKDGECVPKTPVCDEGYHLDENNTCVPDNSVTPEPTQ